MATFYTTKKFKVLEAKRLRDRFIYDTPREMGYIYIGKTTPYANDNVASELVDSVAGEKLLWDNMIAAKRVLAGDVEIVTQRNNWISGRKYKAFDDTTDIDSLLSSTVVSGNTTWPQYVMNSEGNVYKCLSNNISAVSTVEPTGTYTQTDGFVETADGYLWKYMYNVRPSNKFLTSNWMPAPFGYSNTSLNDYDMSVTNPIDGSLNDVVVVNSGTGYYHSSVNVSSFSQSSSFLSITDDINLTTSNIKVGMSVTGTGILSGTYITSINSTLNRIFLSDSTVASGGGSGNTISIITRVVVEGDGAGATATAILNGNGGIRKIQVESFGSGYNRANVRVYGSGTNFSSRCVLPPKGGHAYNPAMELGGSNVMFIERIGEVDSTENGLIPIDVAFRQYGLLLNPYKYDGTQITETNANNVVSQTTTVTLLAGLPYTISERVFQGAEDNPTFEGRVVSQTTNSVELSNVYGTPTIGSILAGETSGANRPVFSYVNPDLLPYVGDMSYAKNVLSIERSAGQAEEIKLVFQF